MLLGLLAFAPPTGCCRDGCLAQPLDRARLSSQPSRVLRPEQPEAKGRSSALQCDGRKGSPHRHVRNELTAAFGRARRTTAEISRTPRHIWLQYAAPSLDLALRKPLDSSKANMRGFEASRDAACCGSVVHD